MLTAPLLIFAQFFRWIEQFSDHYQHTIAALSSLGTLAAVTVSLVTSYVAQRASRPRLKAYISIYVIMDPTKAKSGYPNYIVANLTNIGNIPVRIGGNCISWAFPFRKVFWLAKLADLEGDPIIGRKLYPLTMMPWTSEMVYISTLEDFQKNAFRLGGKNRFENFIADRFLRARVYTDSGIWFPAKISKRIQKEFSESRKVIKAKPEDPEDKQ